MEERKISKAFGSVIIDGDSRGVCAIFPPYSPYFLPKRCRISAVDMSVSVGGSSQPFDGLHIDNYVDWMLISSEGLARELEIKFYNPNDRRVIVFVCIDGLDLFSCGVSNGCDQFLEYEQQSKLEGSAESSTAENEVNLEPYQQRVIEIVPTESAFFEPHRIYLHACRTDLLTSTRNPSSPKQAKIPFLIINAYILDKLLYGINDANHLFNPDPEERPGERGILASHLTSNNEWGDISWWPIFSIKGLSRRLGLIVYNPWHFKIRASAKIIGRPIHVEDMDQGARGAKGSEQMAFSSYSNPAPSTFDALADKNRGHKMSAEEAEEQRRSFVYGNCRLDNERVTREMVDQVANELAAVNETPVGNPSLIGRDRVRGWRNESGLPVHLHWEAVGDGGDRLAVIKAVGATERTH